MVNLLAIAFALIHPVKAPPLSELFRPEMVDRVKLVWSRVEDGQRVAVEIQGGAAQRTNPQWAPEPSALDFDLSRHRELVKLLRSSRLSQGHARAAAVKDERRLEVFVETRSREGITWTPVASWAMPARTWQRGAVAPLFEALEPLFRVNPSLFVKLSTRER
jgi:hypothetical protein